MNPEISQDNFNLSEAFVAMEHGVEALKTVAEEAPHLFRSLRIPYNGQFLGVAAFSRRVRSHLDYLDSVSRDLGFDSK